MGVYLRGVAKRRLLSSNAPYAFRCGGVDARGEVPAVSDAAFRERVVVPLIEADEFELRQVHGRLAAVMRAIDGRLDCGTAEERELLRTAEKGR